MFATEIHPLVLFSITVGVTERLWAMYGPVAACLGMLALLLVAGAIAHYPPG